MFFLDLQTRGGKLADSKWLEGHSKMCNCYRAHITEMVALEGCLTEKEKQDSVDEFIKKVQQMKNEKLVADSLAFMERAVAVDDGFEDDGKEDDDDGEEGDKGEEAAGGRVVADDALGPLEGVETDSGGESVRGKEPITISRHQMETCRRPS